VSTRRLNRSPVQASTLDDVLAEAREAARRRGMAEGKLLAKRRAGVEDHAWESFIRCYERFAEMNIRYAAGLRNKELSPPEFEVEEILEDLRLAGAWIDRIIERHTKARSELAKPRPPAG
jgi:hypothetical protein